MARDPGLKQTAGGIGRSDAGEAPRSCRRRIDAADVGRARGV